MYFLPYLDRDRRIAEQRHAALAAVGVAGDLQQNVAVRRHDVEIVRLVNQREHRRVSGNSLERPPGIGPAAPDEIRACDGK